MLERLESFFLTEPERLIGMGSVFAFMGMWLILFGLVGNVATSAINGLGIIGGHAGVMKTLADIYPSLPTWWVPETIVGASPAMALISIGIWFNLLGRHFRHIMGNYR
jgi:hypothetical protein